MFTGMVTGNTVWLKDQIGKQPAYNQYPVFEAKKQVYHDNFYMGNNREHKYMSIDRAAILHHAALYCNACGLFARKR